MKTARKLFAVLFILSLLVGLGISASASDTEPSYSVRIYAGNQGTIGDLGPNMVTETINAGANLVFDTNTIKPTDSDKYYVRGIYVAGQDTKLYSGNVSIAITEDTDFTAVYGMKSKAVQYTVTYETEDGTTLHEPSVLWGSIGDKPIVAGVYVEGYIPQAYKLTKTLSDNPADNVFTFLYRPIRTAEVTPTPEPPQGGQGGQGGQVGQGGGQAGQPAGQGGQAGQGGAQGGQTEQGENPGGTTTPTEPAAPTQPTTPAEPEEIIDLDVPLAGPDAGLDTQSEMTTQTSAKTARGAIIAGVGAIIAALVALWYALIYRKKKND